MRDLHRSLGRRGVKVGKCFVGKCFLRAAPPLTLRALVVGMSMALCLGAPVQTEFRDRKLVSKASNVEIRRGEASEAGGSQVLEVEGVANEEFFKIREAVYKMYSAV